MKTVITDADGVGTIIGVEDGKLVTGTTQDCTPILEAAKTAHNEGRVGSSDMKLAASIPRVIVDKYLNDNNITLHEFSTSADHKKRLLNDPALAYFRIWKGRV